MTTVAEALQRDTLVWRRGEQHRLELRHDDDVFATIDDGEVVVDGRRMLLADIRGQVILTDTTRGAKVAAIRLVGHGTGRVGAVTLARHRIRVSKVAVNPFRWHATDGLGGPVLVEAFKWGGTVRLRAGSGFDPDVDAGIVAVVTALTMLPELGVGAPAAAA